MNIQDLFPLGLAGLISLLSKGLSRVFSNTTVQKHQFFGTQLSLRSNSHIHTLLLKKKHIALTRRIFVGKVVSRFLIVNNAAMNIWVHISFWIIVLSRYMPRSGIAESYGNSSCSSVILACNFLIVWCLCVVLVSEWLWPRRMSLVPLQFFGRVSEGELSMIIIESYIC